MFHVRRMFGGNLAVGWPAALVARHYMDGFVDRLTSAVRVSEDFYTAIARHPKVTVERIPERHQPLAPDLEGRRRRARWHATLSDRGILLPGGIARGGGDAGGQRNLESHDRGGSRAGIRAGARMTAAASPRMPPSDAPEAQLAAFMARDDPGVARVAQEARAELRHQLPGAFELVYDNYNALVIGFSPTEKTPDAIRVGGALPAVGLTLLPLRRDAARSAPFAPGQRQAGSFDSCRGRAYLESACGTSVAADGGRAV